MSPASTPSESLDQSLAKLHVELAGASGVDEHARTLLRQVLADIERLLREGEGVAAGSAAAPHRLEAMAGEFESKHPALAASLRQFIDLLGKTGL
jgi:hypothetical protein